MIFSFNKAISKEIMTPKILEGNKSNTLNNTGYIFFTFTPVTKKFLDKEATAGKRLLEIGAGFSNVPIEAIKQNISEYVANDISQEHLDILQQKIIKLGKNISKEKLTFLVGKSPEILKKVNGKFDAILADKVIHFLSPGEINEFIEITKSLLVKEGKIYITMASPYSARYKNVLSQYLRNKKNGEEFPGYFKDITNRLNQSESIDKNYPTYKVPDSMVLFAREDLVRLFESRGMKVISSYSMKLPTTENPEWLECEDNKSNIVGIIAVNHR